MPEATRLVLQFSLPVKNIAVASKIRDSITRRIASNGFAPVGHIKPVAENKQIKSFTCLVEVTTMREAFTADQFFAEVGEFETLTTVLVNGQPWTPTPVSLYPEVALA